MSLITRCPACGTMFKVVTDQLKVSYGWVRCGNCADVFDASKHLLPREPGTPATTIIVTQNPAPDDLAGVLVDDDAEAIPVVLRPDNSGADEAPVDPPDAKNTPAEPEWSFPRWVAGKLSPAPESADAAATPAAASPATDDEDSAADFDPAGWKEEQRKRQQREDGAASNFASLTQGSSITHSQVSDFSSLDDEPPRRPELTRRATVADAEFEEEFDAAMQPDLADRKDVSFVREAERKAFWTRPSIRRLLLGLSLLLGTTLVAQVALQQKDTLAVVEPKLAPVLKAVCGQLGCEIRPPRRVESLVIDSSTFNKIDADAYRLSFVLKNTGNLPVEMPAIEVTLTDTQEQAVVRRVIQPAEFGAESRVLAARAEMAGAVNMRVASDASSTPAAAIRVAGYRVLAFYP